METELPIIDDCHFCKNKHPKVNPQRVGKYSRTCTHYQVVCHRCGARGPKNKVTTIHDAINAWNRARSRS
jgi:hypothetical protein